MISIRFQGKPFNITVTQVYDPASNAEEPEVEQFYEDLQHLLEITAQKDVLFIIGNWDIKVRSQEIPGVTDKFALEYRIKQGKMDRVLPRECNSHSKHPLPTTQDSTHGHLQMANTNIRLIIFFAATDGEDLYSQQNQD